MAYVKPTGSRHAELRPEGLIWCDRPARLAGSIYVKTEADAPASEQAALEQLPHALDALNPSHSAEFEPDAHVPKC
jgi:hypothetical protein